jgi:hypothetical protein
MENESGDFFARLRLHSTLDFGLLTQTRPELPYPKVADIPRHHHVYGFGGTMV